MVPKSNCIYLIAACIMLCFINLIIPYTDMNLDRYMVSSYLRMITNRYSRNREDFLTLEELILVFSKLNITQTSSPLVAKPITLAIMNFKRPKSLNFMLSILVKYDIINEILVANCKRGLSITVKSPKIRIIDSVSENAEW